MKTKVGIIGLGTIGKPIAQRIVQAGFPAFVHDIRSEPVTKLRDAGATACESSADVAAHSDVIISLVLDGAQTDDVVFGANGVVRTIRPGA
ncbi:MAG: NAD(P)-binding domain-containing protein, partial [Betaproteobacteria bacterium]